MNLGIRPCIVLGNGCRSAAGLLPSLMDLGIPVLTSWQAADLVDNWHPNYYGRPGIYGQRLANKVVYSSDHIISIGCRWSVWMAGYGAFQREGRMTVVDIDEQELARFKEAETIRSDAGEFIQSMDASYAATHGHRPWIDQCRKWRENYPWLEEAHQHTNFINPHKFISELSERLSSNAVIVADCATGSLCAHQVLRLKPGQRLMTSGGLGEMGCGLPAAIGASFARGKGEVICLMTDGAMMMNLQELQTIATHQLPIKIIVFSNDGYGMIRGAQRNMGMEYAGVSKGTGVECPEFSKIAGAFGITSGNLKTVCFEAAFLNEMLHQFDGKPYLLNVPIDPEYQISPKLQPKRLPDGTIENACYEEMT